MPKYSPDTLRSLLAHDEDNITLADELQSAIAHTVGKFIGDSNLAVFALADDLLEVLLPALAGLDLNTYEIEPMEQETTLQKENHAMTTTIQPGYPKTARVHSEITAQVLEDGFFQFSVNGHEIRQYFIGSWEGLDRVYSDLQILDCVQQTYSTGETIYSLAWSKENFGSHPIGNVPLHHDSLVELYNNAAMFLAGYYAVKEGA